MLTIAYLTARRNCNIHWLVESLERQMDNEGIRFVIVDCYASERCIGTSLPVTVHVPPKPNVWQGEHRLTKENWWAKANAANTALCLAPDGWILFVDDRSVLMPGFLACCREAMAGNYAAFATYEKAYDVRACNGEVTGFTPAPDGKDRRLQFVNAMHKPTPCGGEWCFGCGILVPVEWALSVNGFDECADGMSFEDVLFGLMLEKHGYPMKFDPRMKILEDRTPTDAEPVFRRTDKGVSPNDKSHKLLHMVMKEGRTEAPNFFGEGRIRALRQRVLAGEPFPILQCPTRDWFDGQEISTM